jgi:hypothetical protein
MTSLVFSSPRRRRLTGRVVAVFAVTGAIAAAIALLPTRSHVEPATTSQGAADLVSTPATVPVTAKRRHAIDTLLDRFLPPALERRDLDVARTLVTPSFAAGVTDAEWRRGQLPVLPYKPRDSRFRGWVVNYAYENEVSLDVLVHPSAKEQLGAIAFTTVVKRRHGRWLIDELVPAASFAKEKKAPRILAQPDFQPNMVMGATNKSRLSATWLAVPAVVLATILLVPLVIVLLNVRRSRRATRSYRALNERIT